MTETETVETVEKVEQPAKVEKVIKPDLQFAKDVIAAGGDSMKKCYQCATCTVVCNVTPEDNPFPRKEMVQAQWGLKDELYRNPDIWLCHQCSDCTAYCPRGAKPGEVLGAIRKMSLQEFATPSFLAKMVGSPAGLLFLLALPIVVLLGLIGAFGHFPGSLAGEEISFAKFAPTVLTIDLPFTAAAVFAVVMFVMGISRYWGAMSENAKPQGSVVTTLVDIVKEILTHERFEKCDFKPKRKTAHMLLLYSFIALFITTNIGFVREWGHLIGLGAAEHALYVPMKIIGNAGAIALLLGVAIVILNRFAKAAKLGLGSYFDWLLIVVIASIAVTGTLAQLLRMGGAQVAYWVYFIHLVAVFFLFAYAPYSKMAHMVYRTAAMVYSRMTGRDS
jgi:quinone-modifying oxidoreductase subunit QmoC